MRKKSRPSGFLKCVWHFFLKCLALLLVFCCVTGGVLMADIVRERGGSYYKRLSENVIWHAKRLLLREKTVEEMDIPASLNALADAQLETDSLLMRELESGAYTPDAPLVVNDPYGISPLTAIVLFQTKEPARISLHIAGDTASADVAYSFRDYNTDHMIPVYGLYADRANRVTLTASTQNGNTQTTELNIETDTLPSALANETVRAYTLNESAYQPGFNFTYMGNNSTACKSAFDANGAYRWYLDTGASSGLPGEVGYCGNYNGGNSVYIACGDWKHGQVAILELNYLGKLLNAYCAPYGAHHEIERTRDSLLITGSNSDATIEDLLYEIDLASGEITNVLDYRAILQPTRNQTKAYPEKSQYYTLQDWCHMNSICENGDNLVVSCRNQSAVVCNDREGNIQWMLCEPTDYYAHFQRYILKPLDDDFVYPIVQHAAEVLPDQDGNPDTVDILLFDNGDFMDPQTPCSRMVQYRVNEKEMTVEQVWSYGDGRTDLHSRYHGSALLLDNGNRLGSFEPCDAKFKRRWAYAAEVADGGDVVWECWRVSKGEANEYSEYRLDRLEIYQQSANALHLGERASLFLSELTHDLA